MTHPDAATPMMIGTAGWSIPREASDAFAGAGSHLERYARVMPAAEINSSFHRPHRRSTYARWAASTPDRFRFSVKIPRTISHQHKLADTDALLDGFLEEAGGLGAKLGVVLLQLPPSLAFDPAIAPGFLESLRRRLAPHVHITCEPRHASWLAADAEACLVEHRVARVAADPARAEGGERTGGWPGLRYHRLHGSPRMYYSSYDDSYLAALAATMAAGAQAQAQVWCIFDNTASGAATGDALRLRALLG
ncbi:DUF72 domain-containing protein [Sphingomonas qomolangmaensis]|uniref:DUF72 domain-containing protein n=1 Tax=Sphingomonas qomolangmaensis TaxID=2918765 RepID=A0ABY5LBQ1_9SPHN|nr:DUF72 domain-containing protein [Sphingomonas qomolangmaensis]UUL83159.1 DUF72 domain-containing protein [Sphingomonas qomolangmaensis]